jgi:addiction module HigA family antidote
MLTKSDKIKPMHPGQILKAEYLDSHNISVTELAAKIGVSRNTLSSIINERAGVSADMALRLSRAFLTTPELWLQLQTVYELWEATQQDSGWKEVEPLELNKNQSTSTLSRHNPKRKRVPRV